MNLFILDIKLCLRGDIMKKLLIFCFFLASVIAVDAEPRRVVMQTPYINNPYYRQSGYYQSEVLPHDLSALERYSMNRVYSRETPLRRLERLENLAFGSIQSGNLESRYRNVESAILSRPKSNFKHNALGTLTNYFRGQATGVTPSIYDNFYNYMPAYDNFMHNGFNNYGNSRINQYSNGIFGSGYSIFNNNAGSSSSIRILD